MFVLPPLRTPQGIHVPDLSGLRLRFAKHADEQLTLSMGMFLLCLINHSWRFGGEERRVCCNLRREFLDVHDRGHSTVSMGSTYSLTHR